MKEGFWPAVSAPKKVARGVWQCSFCTELSLPASHVTLQFTLLCIVKVIASCFLQAAAYSPQCSGSGFSKLPSLQSTHNSACLMWSSDPELAFVLLWPPWGLRRA